MEEKKIISKRIRRQKSLGKLGNIYGTLLLLFIYIPVLIMIVYSFNAQAKNYYWAGFTLEWYQNLFEGSKLIPHLWTSLIVAFAATAISVVIGTIGAVGLMRFEFKMKRLISNSLYIPIVVPEVVLGISLLILFDTAKIPLGMPAIILAHATFCIPFVIIIMRGRLAGMDMSVEEASMDLGANRFVTFFKITLPMLVPGILSGAFISFTLSIDDVIISNFVAGPYSTTLPVKILSMVRAGFSPEINALTSMMVFVLLVGILLNSVVQVLLRKRARANIKVYF